MLLNLLTDSIDINKKTESIENDSYKVYWEGFLFIEGFAPGDISVNYFLDRLKEEPLEKICEILHGIFACFLINKKEHSIHSFSDNNGIYNLFKSPNAVATSFLDLIKLNQLNKSNLNLKSVNDFILATSNMGWKTVFDEINKVKYNQIINVNGKKQSLSYKNLEDLFTKETCENSILESFLPIVNSLKKLDGKISVDLSGGLDTRLIATILDAYHLDFETAISGMPGNLDVEISKDVASALDKQHYITYHQINPQNIQKELDECFIVFEGLLDIVAWHRYLQFQQEKQKRGCILTITGHAGELYKYEFIWNTNNKDPITTIRQLITWGSWIRYGTSFGTIPFGIFSEEFKRYSREYKNRIVNHLLKNYGNDKSGKTGPKIYVYFMEGSRTANMGPIINRYSPMLDRSIFPCGTTLKYGKMNFWEGLKRMIEQPWDNRFTFQRKYITHLNKKVAKVNTTYTMGYSVSTKRIEEIKRLIMYYLKNKVIKESRPTISANHPDLYQAVKSLHKTEELIEILKNENILSRNTQLEDINNLYFGSLYTIARIIEFCEEFN